MEEIPLQREMDLEEQKMWDELRKYDEEHPIEVPNDPDFRPFVCNDWNITSMDIHTGNDLIFYFFIREKGWINVLFWLRYCISIR